MKYIKGMKLKRKETNQDFIIKKSVGISKKLHLFGYERVYELKGQHPSLDLIVRKSELNELFIVVG